jgi:mycothiol synthase
LHGARLAGPIAQMDPNVAIQWWAITAEDGAEWARLLLAVEESYGTEDIVGAEDLVEELGDPYVDAERGTIAAFNKGA